MIDKSNELNFNSFVSISTCDCYGKASCVVFFNECNFRCKNCYNKQTWDLVNLIDINEIKTMIKSCIPFISTVTFSGGEPYVQYKALKELIKYSKSIGLYTAIETNGYFTERIKKVQPDALFVDIKAPIDNPDEYYNNTCTLDSCENVVNTLDTDIPSELRIVDNLDVVKIKKSLRNKGYKYSYRVLSFRKEYDRIE